MQYLASRVAKSNDLHGSKDNERTNEVSSSTNMMNEKIKFRAFEGVYPESVQPELIMSGYKK